MNIMISMPEYSILSILPESVGSYARSLRLRIEQEFRLGGPTEFPVPAHVTLKYRFAVADLAELENALRRFCTAQVKTPWALEGFDFFDNGDSFVIFLKVVPSAETRAAHARLLDCLREIPWMTWGPFDHAGLRYHVTLASKGLAKENFAAVWAWVNRQPVPRAELYLDNLALLEIAEGQARVIRRFGLDQESL